MRFAVVGAGAIGGYVGACLARGGTEVTLIARGAHLAAIREHGIRVLSADGDFLTHPQATDDMAAAADARSSLPRTESRGGTSSGGPALIATW